VTIDIKLLIEAALLLLALAGQWYALRGTVRELERTVAEAHRRADAAHKRIDEQQEQTIQIRLDIRELRTKLEVLPELKSMVADLDKKLDTKS
jgi:chromosome segregation ATPase